MARSWVYVGIDQTGAVDKKGIPRPLPACVLKDSDISFFYLPTLSRKALYESGFIFPKEKLLVCVDCVFGLPEALAVPWPLALERTKSYPGYGRKVAQEFFRDLGCGQKPRRRTEVLCKANSVFQEKPFQKNIQTGTFRLWKELYQNRNDFFIPALESKTSSKQIPLFEGYPSLSWRILLNSSRRKPENLASLLKAARMKIKWTQASRQAVAKDANFADALLLALTMRTFHREAMELQSSPEGHILGAPPE